MQFRQFGGVTREVLIVVKTCFPVAYITFKRASYKKIDYCKICLNSSPSPHFHTWVHKGTLKVCCPECNTMTLG